MIRVERNTRNKLAQSRPKNLTFGKYVESLLDFKQKFDMKEKGDVIGLQTSSTIQQPSKELLINGQEIIQHTKI
jgi:hypothetical protein